MPDAMSQHKEAMAMEEKSNALFTVVTLPKGVFSAEQVKTLRTRLNGTKIHEETSLRPHELIIEGSFPDWVIQSILKSDDVKVKEHKGYFGLPWRID